MTRRRRREIKPLCRFYPHHLLPPPQCLLCCYYVFFFERVIFMKTNFSFAHCSTRCISCVYSLINISRFVIPVKTGIQNAMATKWIPVGSLSRFCGTGMTMRIVLLALLVGLTSAVIFSIFAHAKLIDVSLYLV